MELYQEKINNLLNILNSNTILCETIELEKSHMMIPILKIDFGIIGFISVENDSIEVLSIEDGSYKIEEYIKLKNMDSYSTKLLTSI